MDGGWDSHRGPPAFRLLEEPWLAVSRPALSGSRAQPRPMGETHVACVSLEAVGPSEGVADAGTPRSVCASARMRKPR